MASVSFCLRKSWPIYGRAFLPGFCPILEMTEFHPQNGRLKRIETAVHAQEVHSGTWFGCRERAEVAAGLPLPASRAVTMPPSPAHPRFLDGKKLKQPDVANAANFLPVIRGSDRLRGILDHRQGMLRSAICRIGRSSAASPNRCTGRIARVFFVTACSIKLGLILKVSGLNVHKNGGRAGPRNGSRRGDKRKWRGDDFVAGARCPMPTGPDRARPCRTRIPPRMERLDNQPVPAQTDLPAGRE